MKKLTYLAVFEPSSDGYGVYFPDFPGCVGFGATFEEAHRSAQDALRLDIYGMEKDGDYIPEPSASLILEEGTDPAAFISPVTI